MLVECETVSFFTKMAEIESCLSGFQDSAIGKNNPISC